MSGSMFALRPEAREFTPSGVSMAAVPSVATDQTGSAPVVMGYHLCNGEGLLAPGPPQPSSSFPNRVTVSCVNSGGLDMPSSTSPTTATTPGAAPQANSTSVADKSCSSSVVTSPFSAAGSSSGLGASGPVPAASCSSAVTAAPWTRLNPDAPPFVPTATSSVVFDATALHAHQSAVVAHHFHHVPHHLNTIPPGRPHTVTNHPHTSQAGPLLHVSTNTMSSANAPGVAMPLAPGASTLAFAPLVMSDPAGGAPAAYHGSPVLDPVSSGTPLYLPHCPGAANSAEPIHYHYDARMGIAHHHAVHPGHSPSYIPAYQHLSHHQPTSYSHTGSPLIGLSYRGVPSNCVEVVGHTPPSSAVAPSMQSAVGVPCSHSTMTGPSYTNDGAAVHPTQHHKRPSTTAPTSFPLPPSPLDAPIACTLQPTYVTDTVTSVKDGGLEFYAGDYRKQAVGISSSYSPQECTRGNVYSHASPAIYHPQQPCVGGVVKTASPSSGAGGSTMHPPTTVVGVVPEQELAVDGTTMANPSPVFTSPVTFSTISAPHTQMNDTSVTFSGQVAPVPALLATAECGTPETAPQPGASLSCNGGNYFNSGEETVATVCRSQPAGVGSQHYSTPVNVSASVVTSGGTDSNAMSSSCKKDGFLLTHATNHSVAETVESPVLSAQKADSNVVSVAHTVQGSNRTVQPYRQATSSSLASNSRCTPSNVRSEAQGSAYGETASRGGPRQHGSVSGKAAKQQRPAATTFSQSTGRSSGGLTGAGVSGRFDNRRSATTGVKQSSRTVGATSSGRGKKYGSTTAKYASSASVAGTSQVTTFGTNRSVPAVVETVPKIITQGSGGKPTHTNLQHKKNGFEVSREAPCIVSESTVKQSSATEPVLSPTLLTGTVTAVSEAGSRPLKPAGGPSWAERVRQGAPRPVTAAVGAGGVVEPSAIVSTPASATTAVGTTSQPQPPAAHGRQRGAEEGAAMSVTSQPVTRPAQPQHVVPPSPDEAGTQTATAVTGQRNMAVPSTRGGTSTSEAVRSPVEKHGGRQSTTGTKQRHTATGGRVDSVRGTNQRRTGGQDASEKTKSASGAASCVTAAPTVLTVSKKSEPISDVVQTSALSSTGNTVPTTSTSDNRSRTVVSALKQTDSVETSQRAPRTVSGVSWASIARRPITAGSSSSSGGTSSGDGGASQGSLAKSTIKDDRASTPPSKSTDATTPVTSDSPSSKRKIGNAPLATTVVPCPLAHHEESPSRTTEVLSSDEEKLDLPKPSVTHSTVSENEPPLMESVISPETEKTSINATPFSEPINATTSTGSAALVDLPVSPSEGSPLKERLVDPDEEQEEVQIPEIDDTKPSVVPETQEPEKAPTSGVTAVPSPTVALTRSVVLPISAGSTRVADAGVRRSGVKLTNAPLERIVVPLSDAVVSTAVEKKIPSHVEERSYSEVLDVSREPVTAVGDEAVSSESEVVAEAGRSSPDTQAVQEVNVKDSNVSAEDTGSAYTNDLSPDKPSPVEPITLDDRKETAETVPVVPVVSTSAQDEEIQPQETNTVVSSDTEGILVEDSDRGTVVESVETEEASAGDSAVTHNVQETDGTTKVITGEEKCEEATAGHIVDETDDRADDAATNAVSDHDVASPSKQKIYLTPPPSLVYPFSLMLQIRQWCLSRDRSSSTSSVPLEGHVGTGATASPASSCQFQPDPDGKYSLPFLMSRKPEGISSRGLSLTTMASQVNMRGGKKTSVGTTAAAGSQGIWRGRANGAGSSLLGSTQQQSLQQPQFGLTNRTANLTSLSTKQTGANTGRPGGTTNRRNGAERSGTGRDASASQVDTQDPWRLQPVPPKAPKNSRLSRAANITDHGVLIYRKLRGILNKLTVEKFDTLYEQIKTAGMVDADDVRRLMELICSKAKTQHHFIPMYVQLCVYLHRDLPTMNVINEGDEQFRRLLVDACQTSFEETLKPIQVPEGLSEEEAFEYVLFEKKKMKGNMIFVGELGKKKMIAGKVLSNCISYLLANKGEPQLEALCVLLTAAGHYISSGKLRLAFEKQMGLVSSLMNDPTLSTRIRCLLQDVVEDYNEGWKKAKRDTDGPKRLDQLHKEVANETRQRGAAVRHANDYGGFGAGAFRHHSQRGDNTTPAGEDDFQLVGARRGLRANRTSAGRDLNRSGMQPAASSNLSGSGSLGQRVDTLLPPTSQGATSAGMRRGMGGERCNSDNFDRFGSQGSGRNIPSSTPFGNSAGSSTGLVDRFGGPPSGSLRSRGPWERNSAAPKEEPAKEVARPVMSFFGPSKGSVSRSVMQPIGSIAGLGSGVTSPLMERPVAKSNTSGVTNGVRAEASPQQSPVVHNFDKDDAKSQLEALSSSIIGDSPAEFDDSLSSLKEYFVSHGLTDEDLAYLVSHVLFLVADARVARQPILSKWLAAWRTSQLVSEAALEQGFKDFIMYKYESTKWDAPNLRALFDDRILKDAQDAKALSLTVVEELRADIERADNAPPSF